MIFFPVQAFEPARRAGRLPLEWLIARYARGLSVHLQLLEPFTQLGSQPLLLIFCLLHRV